MYLLIVPKFASGVVIIYLRFHRLVDYPTLPWPMPWVLGLDDSDTFVNRVVTPIAFSFFTS